MAPLASRALPPSDAPSRLRALRGWLVGSFAGRALVAGGAIKLLTLTLMPLVGPPAGVWGVVDTLADVSILLGAVAIAVRVAGLIRRRFLWRVRRKLTLSYIFIGVVPALLIISFFLLAGLLLFFNVSAYLTQSRIETLVSQAELLAQIAAEDLRPTDEPEAVAAVVERRRRVAVNRYPNVSYAVVPAGGTCPAGPAAGAGRVEPIVAGPWAHLDAPAAIPPWVPCEGHAGLAAYTEGAADAGGTTRLVVRAIAFADEAGRAVVVEFPLGADVASQFRADTGIEIGNVTALAGSAGGVVPAQGRPLESAATRGAEAVDALAGRLQWVAFLDVTDWNSGQNGSVTMAIGMSATEIYARITEAAITPLGVDLDYGQILLGLLAAVGGGFLVIQFVAFVMGLALARSITGSVHELFTGTERVRQGDFAHKIAIRTHDQLGELAASFNSMTASVEDLLQQKAEKERLEEELRIAREIQMSLLPQDPPAIEGLTLTAHCRPAREMGGDYYDLLRLDEHRLGVLIADVSGKGTSAALYMAELKGLVLSLSLQHSSPRDLLIAADRILANHLDSRSFITVIYAVVDLQAHTLTYARAGHCPLIYRPGPRADPRPVQVLAPDGLVLGLQLDEGETFTRLLQEATLPLGAGDVVLLFTDGLSEAMNATDECFGEERLGALVEAYGDLDSEVLRERILGEIQTFVGTAPQHDDMTMLLIKVTGDGQP